MSGSIYVFMFHLMGARQGCFDVRNGRFFAATLPADEADSLTISQYVNIMPIQTVAEIDGVDTPIHLIGAAPREPGKGVQITGWFL